jgi:predicted GNAT family N-acyltransferase
LHISLAKKARIIRAMTAQPFAIRLCNWNEARADARHIRELVFVREQGVPLELEWDEQDPLCDHALAYAANGAAVGTGRLLPDGHVGRMAVLKEWRGKGVGALLLQALVKQARQGGHASVRLNAQAYAAGFYRRFGFEIAGSEFTEAGILHLPMQCDFSARPAGNAG